MYETLLINGNDIAKYATCVQSLDGLYTVGAPRGDNIVFPGVDGETWVDKPFGTQTLELGLFLRGDTTAELNQSLRYLRQICAPGRPLTLTRRMGYLTGNEEHTARGGFVGGLQPTLQFMRFAKTSLTLAVYDGVWHESFTRSATFNSGGSISVPGETRTHRMTITIPPRATLSNVTNGHAVAVNATGNGNVVIDVETMTATQDGSDVSYAMTWNKRYPMRLDAGVNQFAGSSGTIIYRAAYL